MDAQLEFAEEWLPIPGFEGYYEVSNLGRVRSVARIDSIGRKLKGRLLRQHIDRNGYHHVALSKQAKARNPTVHHLMVIAFLGPYPPGHIVDHVDGNKSHNTIGNLEYVTYRESFRRATALGLRDARPGARLTREQVNEIRRLKKEGMRQYKIAELFNVTPSNVSMILTNKIWRLKEA